LETTLANFNISSPIRISDDSLVSDSHLKPLPQMFQLPASHLSINDTKSRPSDFTTSPLFCTRDLWHFSWATQSWWCLLLSVANEYHVQGLKVCFCPRWLEQRCYTALLQGSRDTKPDCWNFRCITFLSVPGNCSSTTFQSKPISSNYAK